MTKKKIDERIRTLIENGVNTQHRSMFIMIGDQAQDQIPNLHYMLSKAQVAKRPSVLWCYKKELQFSSHRKKRMKQLKKKQKLGLKDAGLIEQDPFDLFLSTTEVKYTFYGESEKILGNTFGMVILQDFEAITPNLLARTIETVQGGGMIIFLLQNMTSLKQLYTMSMDVHARYRSHHSDAEPVSRFNERFLLSLTGCPACLVIDDRLNVIPYSQQMQSIAKKPKPTQAPKQALKDFINNINKGEEETNGGSSSSEDSDPILACAATVDQAVCISALQKAVKHHQGTSTPTKLTISLTASRGRGKSATLGLLLAACIHNGYGNVFVTAPTPENLKTCFEFCERGLRALGYEEHVDFSITRSSAQAWNGLIVRISVHRQQSGAHKQNVIYIHPSDHALLAQAEMIVIDEAAAIPLPIVQSLCGGGARSNGGQQLVLMASTINGYEGTGRSLSLKLIKQLRSGGGASSGRVLKEFTLSEPIRYAADDPIEKWLNGLLCLDIASIDDFKTSSSAPAKGGTATQYPDPAECDLYYINRDTLFSHHEASESFLQSMMALYCASHYKNTPNDLQLMSDAPNHHLFILLAPIQNPNTLPQILCVLQVCLEGHISRETIMASLGRGKRASGDLIPWTLSQQFQDDGFGGMSGARIVRIAVHPDLQSMGYGSRAIHQLEQYYRGHLYLGSIEIEDGNVRDGSKGVGESKDEEGTVVDDSNTIAPKSNLPPLLTKLAELEPPSTRMHWLGTSFGLTPSLFKFWSRLGLLPLYVRQSANDVTGEHSMIMLKSLCDAESIDGEGGDWLERFSGDFTKRFVHLLAFQFKRFPCSLSLDILSASSSHTKRGGISGDSSEGCSAGGGADKHAIIMAQVSAHDLKRLESYANNQIDYHVIMDLLPTMAQHYFLNYFCSDGAAVSLSPLQAAILLAIGLQARSIDDLESEHGLAASQLLAMLIKVCRKISKQYRSIYIAASDSTKTNAAAPPSSSVMDGGGDDGSETITNANSTGGNDKDRSIKRPISHHDHWQGTDTTIAADLDASAGVVNAALREKQKELLDSIDLSEYAIGDGVKDEEWVAEIKKKGKNLSKGALLNISSSKDSKPSATASTKNIAAKLHKRKDEESMKKFKKSKYAKR